MVISLTPVVDFFLVNNVKKKAIHSLDCGRGPREIALALTWKVQEGAFWGPEALSHFVAEGYIFELLGCILW